MTNKNEYFFINANLIKIGFDIKKGRQMLAIQDIEEPFTILITSPPIVFSKIRKCEKNKSWIDCFNDMAHHLIRSIEQNSLTAFQLSHIYRGSEISLKDVDISLFSPEFISFDSNKIIKLSRKEIFKMLKLNSFSIDKKIQSIEDWEYKLEEINPKKESNKFGLFPVQSFFNHSCFPNCFYFFQKIGKNQFVSCIKAQRPIKKGEELTISYIAGDMNASYQKRKNMFLKDFEWDFFCECEKCLFESQPQNKLYREKVKEFKKNILSLNKILNLNNSAECDQQFNQFQMQFYQYIKNQSQQTTFYVKGIYQICIYIIKIGCKLISQSPNFSIECLKKIFCQIQDLSKNYFSIEQRLLIQLVIVNKLGKIKLVKDINEWRKFIEEQCKINQQLQQVVYSLNM